MPELIPAVGRYTHSLRPPPLPLSLFFSRNASWGLCAREASFFFRAAAVRSRRPLLFSRCPRRRGPGRSSLREPGRPSPRQADVGAVAGAAARRSGDVAGERAAALQKTDVALRGGGAEVGVGAAAARDVHVGLSHSIPDALRGTGRDGGALDKNVPDRGGGGKQWRNNGALRAGIPLCTQWAESVSLRASSEVASAGGFGGVGGASRAAWLV